MGGGVASSGLFLMPPSKRWGALPGAFPWEGACPEVVKSGGGAVGPRHWVRNAPSALWELVGMTAVGEEVLGAALLAWSLQH